MLVDTEAQVSLITNKVIESPRLINPNKKITISSIHGSQNTLGEIKANIHKNNSKISVRIPGVNS